MFSVITQQSEISHEQDVDGQRQKRQEFENKLIEEETMEHGKVQFYFVKSLFTRHGYII